MDWQFGKSHIKILTWWHNDSPVNDHYGIILDGSIRSGKTLPGSVSYALWAFNQFPNGGGKFIIAGKTIESTYRNVVDPLIKAAPSVGLRAEYKRGDKILKLTKGSRTHDFYLFGGHNEQSQDLVAGFTAHGGFFDEAPLMPKSFFDMATGRVSISGGTLWFTSNPQHPAHWFKREYIDLHDDKGFLYLHLTMDDNLSLSERTIKGYEKRYTGVFYKRYILGQWVAAEGLIYPEFANTPELSFNPEPMSQYGEMFVSCDYGIQNAQVYLLFAWHTKRLRWEIVKEWVHKGRESEVQMTDSEYYQHLLQFVDDLPVTRIIVDPSATSFIATIRKGRRFQVFPADNKVINGIGYTSSLFHIGKLAISVECTETIEEIGGYVWDGKKAERTGEEMPIKLNDHCMDALRYGAYTYIRRYEKRYGINISGGKL